jgi:hypothetical protein
MTFIEPKKLEVLPRPFFIVAEGMGDARFVDELLQLNKITNCSVGCPSQEGCKGMGKDAIPNYLASIQGARTRVASVPLQGLLVVADADGDAAKSLESMVNALRSAAFPVPSRAFSIEGAPLKVAIYLMPGEKETGTLEHLLLKAIFTKTPALEKCIVDYSSCTGGLKSDKPNKHAKMLMSAIAATFCEDNPWASLFYMWDDKKQPVPMDSPHFGPFLDFVKAFAV